jgi:Fur family peroxide stress response transcriptional regulator
MLNSKAYNTLVEKDIRPSIQRIMILQYLLDHHNHPTVENIYEALNKSVPSLSKTTVYNTLQMLAEHKAAQMITIDDHHVCYDGDTSPHVHFYCTKCAKVYDLFNEQAPAITTPRMIEGHQVNEMQLYYKGICADCLKKENDN